MYLSLEEWEYLEHHKEEYDAMKNQPCPADGPVGRSLQASYFSQIDSDPSGFTRNGTLEDTNSVDWKSGHRFIAPKLSCMGACETNSSPKKEGSDKIYGEKNVTAETCGSTQSRDVSTLENDLLLSNEPLSAIFLDAEIKEEQTDFECGMNDFRKVRINNSDQSLDRIQNLVSGILQKTCSHDVWSKQEGLLDGHHIKAFNVTDSSVENNYTLDLVLQPSLEKLQHIPINDYQSKMAELTDSALLNSHTLDRVQSPFGDKLQRKPIKEGLDYKRCLVADQDTKIVEVSDFSQENGRTLSTTNSFKDIPHTTQKQECSTDGHKTVDKRDCPLKNNDAESISNIFQDVFGKAYIRGKFTNKACFIDETKKDESNASLIEDGAFYQLSNSFSGGSQRACIKTEQEQATDGYQKETMDNVLNNGKIKLTYQECLMDNQQTTAEEVYHSTPEHNIRLGIAWPTSNMASTHLDDHFSINERTHLSQNSTWKSTGRVQASGKPLKTISCDNCGKTFCYNSDLSRHRRLHTGEKPFTCSECGKSFSWMSSLVAHRRTHFGEKPFSCKQCGKRFSDYSGIIKHRRSHTGEKPYCCLVCGEHFAETYHLLKHQTVHLVKDVAENYQGASIN